jgi:lipid A disaccharide synthetase
MVNLIAQSEIVPELIQYDMTPEKLAAAATELLTNPASVERMRANLAQVRAALTREGDPFERVATVIAGALSENTQVEQERID